jgi:hypothetical protein
MENLLLHCQVIIPPDFTVNREFVNRVWDYLTRPEKLTKRDY